MGELVGYFTSLCLNTALRGRRKEVLPYIDRDVVAAFLTTRDQASQMLQLIQTGGKCTRDRKPGYGTDVVHVRPGLNTI